MSAWIEEKNAFGGTRRYKIENGIKTYETLISTTNGLVPESRLEDANKRAKDDYQKRLNNKPPQSKVCPFSLGGTTRRCIDSCAFYVDGGCILSSRTKTPEELKSQGKRCPLSETGTALCNERCALNYDGACTYSR